MMTTVRFESNIAVRVTFFGFKERTRHFFGGPRPRRGGHVLAPRDPSDPTTLPTLRLGGRVPGPGPEHGSDGQGEEEGGLEPAVCVRMCVRARVRAWL